MRVATEDIPTTNVPCDRRGSFATSARVGPRGHAGPALLATFWLGLACTGHDAPESDPDEPSPERIPELRSVSPSPALELRCPPGTVRRDLGSDTNLDFLCARGDVPHGPFRLHEFDEREHRWYEVHGEHVDGQKHGLVEAAGFYAVEHSERWRVFRRELHEHGRVVRSNEASLRVELTAAAPVFTRSFVVKAAGITPTASWEGGPAAVGTVDVEVSSSWTDAPENADPSILRAELSTPLTPALDRADALVYPVEDPEPPEVGRELPIGHVPTVHVTWLTCEPAGCELAVSITLRWIAPGPGRLTGYVTVRAVPDVWPDSAPVVVRAVDE